MSWTGSRWARILVVGLPLVLILGAWMYMSATRLHPNPEDIPSVRFAAPLPKWAGAVAQGQQLVRASLVEENLPGLSVAVGFGGEIVWAEGFGFADLRTGAPVAPSHRFRIGTASTVLTAAAAGVLLAEGRLKLDDEIQTYVPAFPKKRWPVRLRELMGHTAGIIPNSGDEIPLFTKHCDGPAEALQHLAEKPLIFQPRTEYRYSNSSWILVSAAIEAAAKQPFLTFMREQVFDPLAMRDTIPDSAAVEDDDFPLANLVREKVFDPRTVRAGNSGAGKNPVQERVTSYFPKYASNPNYGLHLMRPLDYSCYAGSSVFLSTPSDLARFGMAINNGKLLPPALVQLLQTPQGLASGKETGYGLGWDAGTVTLDGKPTRVAGHDGESLGGNVATLMTFPEKGLAVAVMSNISYADTPALARRIAEAFVRVERR